MTTAITVEEAIALLLNLDQLPVGRSVTDMTSSMFEDATAKHDIATTSFKESNIAGGKIEAMFESFFLFGRAEVCRNLYELSLALFEAFQKEQKRGGESILVRAPSSSPVPRFTRVSVSRWAQENFGMHIPPVDTSSSTSCDPEVVMNASTLEHSDSSSSVRLVDSEVGVPSEFSDVSETLGKRRAENVYVTFAYLMEELVEDRKSLRRPDESINISATAAILSKRIKRDPEAKELGDQSLEAIKTRLEDAQKAKRSKLKRR